MNGEVQKGWGRNRYLLLAVQKKATLALVVIFVGLCPCLAQAAPALFVEPQHLVFNAVAGQSCTNRQIFRIDVRDLQGPDGWIVTTNAPWLKTDRRDGSTPGYCDVSVNTTGLAPGTYQGTLLVTGLRAASASATVTLIINPASRVRLAPWQGGKSGAMSVTVDDSQLSGFEDLSTNGFRGSYMLWLLYPIPADFSDFYANGMEIGAHTVHHYQSELDEITAREEIENNIVGILSAVPVPESQIISFARPWGTYNNREQMFFADYFLSTRGYHVNALEDQTPYNFQFLKSFNSREHPAPDWNASAPPNPTDYKTLVDAAIAQGKWFNMVLHTMNLTDGAIHYAVGKNIWFAPQGAVVKYIMQRDRTVVSNYVESTGLIQFDTYRLPMPVSSKRNFESSITSQDFITFKVDITNLANVAGVAVDGVLTPFTTNQGSLVFNAMVTTSPRRVHISTSRPILSVMADNKSRGYRQSNPALTGTVTGLQNGDNITATYTTTATLASPVLSYVITPVLSDPGNKLGNYIAVTNFGALTVTQAVLAVNATATNKVYDGTTTAAVALSYSPLGGDSLTVNWTNAAFANRNVGTGKNVTVSGMGISGSAAGNYKLATNAINTTASITVRPITVTAVAHTKAYDGTASSSAAPNITGGLGTGDTANFIQTFNNKNVGTGKTLTPSGSVTDANGGQNYAVSWANNNAGTVTMRPLTVTATGLNKVYDGTNSAWVTLSDNRMTGDEFTNSYVSAAFADQNVAAGKAITVSGISISGADAGNYTANTSASASADITPATLIVAGENKSRTYCSTNPPLTATINGFVNGEAKESVLTGTPSLSTIATALSPVGSYAITTTNGTLMASNYVFNYINGTLTVNPAILTGTAVNQSRPYGGTNPVFTVIYSGFLNGEDASVVSGTLSGFTPAQTNSPVGAYPISVTGQRATNYTIQYYDGTLNVIPTQLVIRANDASRVYNQPNPVLTATITGWVNGEDTNVLQGFLVLNTTADTNSPLGTYQITPDGVTATNYAIVFQNGLLTVAAQALTVAANNQSRTYGATNPVLTGTLTGLQEGDNISAVYSTPAQIGSGVGSYNIVPTLVDPDNKLSKYSVTISNGILTVLPAILTGTAANQSRPYGQTNPVFTVTYSGFVNGEDASIITGDLSGYTTADTNSPVGSYSVTVSGQSATNYTIEYLDGTLNITPAELIVKAADASRVYGGTNPAFTATLTGWANGEDTNALAGSLILSTSAETNSTVGTYDITASGLSSTNYTLVYSNGTLTITKADSSMFLKSLQNPSPVSSNVTFTVKLSPVAPASTIPTGTVQFMTNGFAAGEPVPLTEGEATINIRWLTSGSHTVAAAYLGDSNFLSSTNTLVQVVNVNMQPATALGIQRNSDGTVKITFAGTPEGSYLIEAALDLVSQNAWEIISTNAAGLDGRWIFIDSRTNYAQRFYRAVIP